MLTEGLLKTGTEEAFRFASNQTSIYPIENSGRTYEDILSDEGLELFKVSEKRYEQGDIKGTFVNYTIKRERSGPWFKPDNTPYKWITRPEEGEIKGMVCSWNDRVVYGYIQTSLMCTSRCIFITDTWCLTKSGSIYKLGEKAK